MKKALLSLLVATLILSLAACLVSPDENVDLGTNESDLTEVLPNSPDQNKTDVITTSTYEFDPNKTDQENLVDGNSAFALNLYQTLIRDPNNKEENLFFSPYSISLALAMTYAGARRDTESQMTQTLNFVLPQDRLHPAFNSLNTEVGSRGKGASDTGEDGFKLNIANAIWGQEGYDFLRDFINLLNSDYGAGLRTVDFEGAPEDSRITINNWISDQTEDRIRDLIPQKAIDEYTRIVLSNAIYFDADWLSKFNKARTEKDYFYPLSGGIATVPMMRQTANFGYAEGEDYHAIELRYKGSASSMIILLPKGISFEVFEESLDLKRLEEIVKNLKSTYVALTMPKFKFESGFKLNDTLSTMGMPLAFTPMPLEQLGKCSNQWADFSGMTGTCELYITSVFHKAFVAVDEEGTEAAAATAVIGGMPESLPPEITIDHPFIFLIRDIKTGTILFLGRVTDPSQ